MNHVTDEVLSSYIDPDAPDISQYINRFLHINKIAKTVAFSTLSALLNHDITHLYRWEYISR